MKLKFIALGALTLTLSLFLMSCVNSEKKSRTIIGELSLNNPIINKDFSKFSGTESYTFKISEPVTLNCELKLRTGKTSITVVDDKGVEYLSINSPKKDSVHIKPEKETTYYVDFKYDNGVGTYSLSIEN